MQYRLLGQSGLRVSELCFGVMSFGTEWGYGTEEEESKKCFDAFINAGGNFFDTADNYTGGHSESLLGRFIQEERERYVIASKYTLADPARPLRPGDPNAVGNHRKHMIEAVEASLKRLNTDYLDLYYVHVWDFLTPIEEVMRGLDDLVRAGKIFYAGVSNAPAYVVARANTIAELRGWTPFVSYEGLYNLLDRSIEREVLCMARDFDMAVCCWQPLASAFLSGSEEEIKIRAKSGLPMPTESQWKVIQLVGEIAREVGRTPAQVGLNWLRQQPGVVIPIVGVRTAEHMTDNLGCLEWRLNEDQMKRLDKATRIDLGYPMSNCAYQLSGMTYNNMLDQIETRGRLPNYFGSILTKRTQARKS
jgi:aryl-alcohol dehydrogenase-like predicted oxidoreductase